MPTAGLYAFESIDETLPFVPLAARRLLDGLGRKLSLEGWLSLPLDDRWQLVRAGLGEVIDAGVASVLDRALPPAELMAPVAEPTREVPPPGLVAALDPGRPLEGGRWQRLEPLDRYALAKHAGRPDKVVRAYDEIVGTLRFSHLTGTGEAHMVDVGAKAATARRAVATARVHTTREVIEAIAGPATGAPPASAAVGNAAAAKRAGGERAAGKGAGSKGDVLAVARIAGLLAAKRTPELIPLCHPVQTTTAAVDFELEPARGEIRVRATVEAFDRTGVEMEAMVAASVASLTVYDMIKSADRWATIEAVRLESKSGGKSGVVTRPVRPSAPSEAPAEPLQARAAPPSGSLVALRGDGAPTVDEAIARVKHPGAGAVCVFLGMVRDHSDGRAVVKLEYEAYPAMAIAEMTRVADEIASEMAGVRLAVVHRTGELAVGDVAIVCAASAPHRGDAYRACRALIDRVKARVPIWKREHGPEGAWWVGWQDARCEAHDHEHGSS